MPKKAGITEVPNKNNKLVTMRPVIAWRVRMDFRKLNTKMQKDQFPMPFIVDIRLSCRQRMVSFS